jgi:cytochrome c5
VNRVAKIIVVLGVALTSGVLSAGTAELNIAERLKKVGEVCIEGQSCADAVMMSEGDSGSGSFDVAGAYGTSCATCHAIGIAGAPKLGDIAAWEPRIAQGMDVLYDHGINGLAPAMPAKGMCFTCSDEDIMALVDYMVDSVQ